ncbi:MAG: permease prefix domain 1-containing protein [Phycisphaerales bacterium]|nr:permease prefix domain 1-containing protein [Phycisphaerales bacterium]
MNRKAFENYLDEIEKALRLRPRHRDAIRAELEDHIETQLRDLLDEGMPPDEAVSRILEDFGHAAVLAQRFGQIGQGRRWIMRSVLAASIIVTATLATSFLMPPQPGNPFSPSQTSAENSAKEVAPESPSASIRIAQPTYSGNEEIRLALKKRVDVMFDSKSLEGILNFVRDIAGVNIFVDWASMENVGIDRGTEVTLNLWDVRISTVLGMALRSAGQSGEILTYAISDGLLMVGTEDVLGRQTETRLYHCADLVQAELSPGDRLKVVRALYEIEGAGTKDAHRYDGLLGSLHTLLTARRTPELIQVIQKTVDPSTWMENGGNIGQISVFNDTLVIVQTAKNHEAIRSLLDGLARVKKSEAKEKQPVAQGR